MNIELLESLLEFFNKEDLKELCEILELPKSGTKGQIIERLVEELESTDTISARETLRNFLEEYTKKTLVYLGEYLEIDVKMSYTKDEIIDTILNYVFEDVQKKNKQIPIENLRRIAKILKDIEMRGSFRDEREFVKVLLAKLEQIKGIKIIDEYPEKDHDLTNILGVNVSYADIIIMDDEYKVPIEVKFISKKDKSNKRDKIIKGLGQALLYKWIYGGAILLIYDSTKTITDRPQISNLFDKNIFIILR